jgi:hypothetical protein
MFELDDVGKEYHLTFDQPGVHDANVLIQMVIKAPKGTIALFDHNYISPDTQCKAIRAFMEEHKYD